MGTCVDRRDMRPAEGPCSAGSLTWASDLSRAVPICVLASAQVVCRPEVGPAEIRAKSSA